MKTATDIIDSDVYCCASELIAELSQHSHSLLAQKARNLSVAIDEHGEPKDVFEHWIVSSWLARKLEAGSELVDCDFAGMAIWARSTSGQSLACDDVIVAIAHDCGSRKSTKGGITMAEWKAPSNAPLLKLRSLAGEKA